MKKILAIVMTFALILSMSVTVFAAEGKGDRNIDVQAKYQDSTTNDKVYSVDVTWGSMQFTYAETGAMVWNPADHSYTDNTKAGWQAVGNTVTVVNHSNDKVTAGFAFEALPTYAGLTGTFDVDTEELAAGVVGEYAQADKVVSTLSLNGTLADTVVNFTKVGVITVTIA